MSESIERHQRVAATAARAQVAPADVVTTLGVLGERVETLSAQLPNMRELHDWLVRIEAKLNRVLVFVDDQDGANASLHRMVKELTDGR